MALVMGACVLVFGLWWQQPVTVAVPRGAQRLVALPDGSSIQLNSDSRLQYQRGFQAWPLLAARQRVVSLEGEAFFEVVRQSRPFVVETFNARVEVLGTQFNVRARSGSLEGETQVILSSGQVRVTASANQTYEAMLTTAGEVARVGDAVEETPMPVVSLDRALAWRQQGFTVVDQSLAFVLAEVERRYALTIAVDEGMTLDTLMTLFYPNGATAERIIHDICLEQGCRYRQTSDGFALVPVPPASGR
jgi:ferric-dicitrate binding protein FerR (iron transport regulator)